MREMSVPFFRPSIGDKEISEVVKCLQSGWLTTGPNARAFEQEFEALFEDDSIQAIAVNSATAALHLGLEALGIGPGDEVLLPTLTFTATAEVVRYLGADPVFVDMDAETLCIDVVKAKEAITEKTKAIMPVHFAGRPCDMGAISRLAQEHGLYVLDDAAHALPTKCDGKLIGEVGADVTAFSFYANKTMTTGEGGMLVTRNPDIAARARIMRLHGIDRDVFNRFSDVKASWMYDVVAPGYKYNMTDVAAAMGRVQLSRIEEFRTDRERLARRYTEALSELPLILPTAPAGENTHSWHLYIVQVQENTSIDRNELIKKLTAANIGTSVHYRPLHQMTFWSESCNRSYPAADSYFQNCVTLPLFMSMTDAEQNYVIETLKKVL
jgi:dTDP-4-amino-4,6-dideoxygalactose transaminase